MRAHLKLYWLARLAWAPFSGGAESSTHPPVPGIIYYSETRTNPPERWLVAEVDLKSPKLRLHVARGGADPDGPGKWQTPLLEPTKIAAREKWDFVVNGDFFEVRGTNTSHGDGTPYRPGLWARVAGPAMSAGQAWSASTNARPCLVVHPNQTATIEWRAQPFAGDWEVISGNTLLVHAGAAGSFSTLSEQRQPRTAIGLDATGTRLKILVVDGRQPGVAVGLSYSELAAEMRRLGCQEALNLDGGGSSVMAVREAATGKMKILNLPSDGRERPVANALGISLDH